MGYVEAATTSRCFFCFYALQSDCYYKPPSAGLKKATIVKRRAEKEEPALFLDRVMAPPVRPKDKVTPIKLAKIDSDEKDKGREKDKSTWTVIPKVKKGNDASKLDPLNPDRKISKGFQLMHQALIKTIVLPWKGMPNLQESFHDF